MAQEWKLFWSLIQETANAWLADRAQKMGAALAFYTTLAISPLFVITFFIVSLWFGATSARAQIFDQINGLIGEQGGKALQAVLGNSQQHATGLFASGIAFVTLILTSTGLFLELQEDLNIVWGVEQKPGHFLRGFIKNRILSFTMVVGIGFLLLVSLLVSAALAALNKYFTGLIPSATTLWQIVNLCVSIGVVTLLFALIFKVLPDVMLAWSDVWVGAVITAILFTVGKHLLGLYLGRSTIASAYGAAGSVIVILLWVYYSAQILFFGAEFTRVYAWRLGRRAEPAPNARWIVKEPSQPFGKWQKRRNGGERQWEILRRLSDQVESWHSWRKN
ncbi:MAG: putative rane protein [Pedosphaera sp.]|nr:putative rane protein [Pedosphaera sp.]